MNKTNTEMSETKDSFQTSTAPICISVDCMGGDAGVTSTLPACAQFLKKHPNVHLLLVGLPEKISLQHPRATLIPAREVVGMGDTIEVALRRKKDSSMRVAIQQVKEGRAHAAVSSGNTGALMAIAKFVLKTMDGIDRPAIASVFPNSLGGSTTILDLGANVDCNAMHLFQFAVMGSALVNVTKNIESPSVGLLNVGEEMIKGNEVIKQAGELLRKAGSEGVLNFFGNVEGNDAFLGTTDLVVCDGFVGNVSLKTTEGVAHMVGAFLRAEFSRNIFTKFVALLAMPMLKAFKNKVDHRRYNGAAFLGLRGLVFKSHGGADAIAFECALERAFEAASNQLLAKLEIRIAQAAPVLQAAQAAQAAAMQSVDTIAA